MIKSQVYCFLRHSVVNVCDDFRDIRVTNILKLLKVITTRMILSQLSTVSEILSLSLYLRQDAQLSLRDRATQYVC